MAFTPRTETYDSDIYEDNLSVAKPSGTAEGDILFALLLWWGTTAAIDSVPDGWTKVADYVVTGDRYALYYKIATDSEPSSYQWGWDNDFDRARIICSCYTGGDFDPEDPIDVVSNTPYGVYDDINRAASMVVSAANSPLLFFGAGYIAGSYTSTKPSVPTTDWVEDDDTHDSDARFGAEICSMIWSSSGATGTMDATMSSYLSMKHAFALALNPSGGGQTHYGSATMAGTGALAALGRTTLAAKATMSGTGSLAATAHVTRSATATMAGTGSLSAEGGLVHLGAGTAAGTGVLAGLGRLILAGELTMAGTGSMSAAGTVVEAAVVYGSATMSGTGALAAAARLILAATATLSGTGALSASAVYTVVAKATLSGEGSLAAIGTLTAEVTASATMAGTGTLTVTTPLIAAQRSLHRLPYVEAKVYDYERGIKRLSWTRLYTGSEPDNHHGIAFDGNGDMHRIRAAADNKLYYQKITSPGPSSDFSQWTEATTDCAGPCAIAAYGAKVYIFYRKTDDTIRKYYSHNHGTDWTDAQLSTYTNVLSLAACWWGTTDTVVCLALKSFQVNRILLDTSDQSTDEKTWSDGTHPWVTTYGLGATYNATLDNCDIVIAAKESDTPYNHFDLFRTRLSETKNFLSLESFLMAPDGEDITYEYPDCHLPASAQEYESTRVLAVEKFAGTTAYTRPLACHLVKGTTWSAATFTEPRPFMDIAPAYGLRMQSTSAHWWLSTPAGVWQAPRPAAAALDLTQYITAMSQPRPGTLVLDLDNSKAHFASPGEGALASLRFRAEIALRLGYKTTLGNEAEDAGAYWIDSWEYSHAVNRSVFTITALDGSGLLDRWTARYQMRWNKDKDDPRSVWQILYHVLARVGIRLTNTPPKPQSSAINNLYPDFALDPGTGGDAAVRRLLSFVPDQLVFRGQEAFTKNPLPAEASSYSYSAGGQGHKVLRGKYGHAVTLSRSRALGQDEGDRIVEDALDWDLLDLAVDILEQVYDPNLENATRTQERADAILTTQATRATPATITVPVNVLQELLDVVDVTDPRCGISQGKYRVLATRTDYDRRTRRYDQTLTLGAP